VVSPFRIVAHKKGEPEYPGKAHKPGLQRNQCKRVENNPEHKPAVFEGKPDKQKPQQEADAGYKQGNQVADVPGTIIETNFNICDLAAGRALRMHIRVSIESKGEGIHKQFSFPAPWTAAGK
jgi:hypothetical protein